MLTYKHIPSLRRIVLIAYKPEMLTLTSLEAQHKLLIQQENQYQTIEMEEIKQPIRSPERGKFNREEFNRSQFAAEIAGEPIFKHPFIDEISIHAYTEPDFFSLPDTGELPIASPAALVFPKKLPETDRLPPIAFQHFNPIRP